MGMRAVDVKALDESIANIHRCPSHLLEVLTAQVDLVPIARHRVGELSQPSREVFAEYGIILEYQQ